jgi:quinohemoprotein ethanol dehydrogenase
MRGRQWRGLIVAASVSAVVFPTAVALQSVEDGRTYSGREWAVPGGDSASTRYSTLAQIDAGNIKKLGGAWVKELPDRQTSKVSPLVKDGQMFVTTTMGQIIALDAATGETSWTYKPEVPFSGSRGVGLGEGLLFAGLRDSTVIAISQKTGQVVWKHQRDEGIPAQGISTAPAYGNGVAVDVVSGGDNFARGRGER